MDSTFYALLFRQKFIKRWGLMRSTTEENLEEHSAECAFLAHALAEIGNRYFGKSYDVGKVVLIALYHDISEVITGDLPTPVKYYNSAIRDNYHEMEDAAVNMLASKLPEPLRQAYLPYLLSDNREIHTIVKAADKLCAYIKCIDETKNGNAEFVKAEATIRESLKHYDCPELHWFCENMLPAFTMTLDEL